MSFQSVQKKNIIIIILSILHRRRPQKFKVPIDGSCLPTTIEPQWFRMDLHFGIKIIELILEINYSIKNIEFNLLCSKCNEHRDEAIS